jgi:hypothetical protein
MLKAEKLSHLQALKGILEDRGATKDDKGYYSLDRFRFLINSKDIKIYSGRMRVIDQRVQSMKPHLLENFLTRHKM